ncbi:MAG: hypothetical protein E4H36_02605 [Spirochaetales bacterium]|nr:MAG: hypothetical protein E4H36_02605 [Spirochaetales bacterium]
MKIFIRPPLLLLTCAVLIFGSCGRPPDGTKTYNLLDFTAAMLKKADELQNNQKELIDFAKAASALETVLSFRENEEIIFRSTDFTPSPEHFAVSIPGNRFRTVKPVYITNGPRNEYLYSLDGETWYRSRNDNDKNIENLHIDFHYDVGHDRDAGRLVINHRTAARVGGTPQPEKIRNKRNIVPLAPGMRYSNTDKKRVTVNLDNNILYLPPGTILKGNFILTGNLLSSRLTASEYSMKALRDLFLFRRGFLFAVSFNNEEWNNGILSFDINFALDLYSPEKGVLEMDILLGLTHKSSAREAKRISLE